MYERQLTTAMKLEDQCLTLNMPVQTLQIAKSSETLYQLYSSSFCGFADFASVFFSYSPNLIFSSKPPVTKSFKKLSVFLGPIPTPFATIVAWARVNFSGRAFRSCSQPALLLLPPPGNALKNSILHRYEWQMTFIARSKSLVSTNCEGVLLLS